VKKNEAFAASCFIRTFISDFKGPEPHPYGVFHDFNHDSPLVRAFVKRNLKFLLEEYRIDGFRFDMTKGFTQNSSTEATAGSYDASRIAILKDYNETVREVNPEAVVLSWSISVTKKRRANWPKKACNFGVT